MSEIIKSAKIPAILFSIIMAVLMNGCAFRSASKPEVTKKFHIFEDIRYLCFRSDHDYSITFAGGEERIPLEFEIGKFYQASSPGVRREEYSFLTCVGPQRENFDSIVEGYTDFAHIEGRKDYPFSISNRNWTSMYLAPQNKSSTMSILDKSYIGAARKNDLVFRDYPGTIEIHYNENDRFDVFVTLTEKEFEKLYTDYGQPDDDI